MVPRMAARKLPYAAGPPATLALKDVAVVTVVAAQGVTAVLGVKGALDPGHGVPLSRNSSGGTIGTASVPSAFSNRHVHTISASRIGWHDAGSGWYCRRWTIAAAGDGKAALGELVGVG
jgi:hypothetical protein